jgi:hypothetical protein
MATTAPTPRGKIAANAKISSEDVVDPLQEVADLAAEKARHGAQHGADQRRDDGRRQAHEDGHLGALDDLGEHVAAQAVAAQRQRLGLGALVGLEGLGALGPFGVARCQRVDVGQVDVRALGHGDDPGVLLRLRAKRGRRCIRHADLLLPAGRDDVGGGQQHEQQKGADDPHRHDADAVGLETPPGCGPDAAGGVGHGAHLRTTRGSTNL